MYACERVQPISLFRALQLSVTFAATKQRHSHTLTQHHHRLVLRKSLTHALSHSITIDEFSEALRKKGQVITEKEIEKIMQVGAQECVVFRLCTEIDLISSCALEWLSSWPSCDVINGQVLKKALGVTNMFPVYPLSVHAGVGHQQRRRHRL